MQAPEITSNLKAESSLQIDPLMSCEESTENKLHEVELSIQQSEAELGSSSILRVAVHRRNSEQKWQIARRYEDCQWLFKALKDRFPGKMLPYFPANAVTDYIEAKIKALNIKVHKQYYAPRLQQLAAFLSAVCKNPEWGKAQQVQIFLLSGQQFQKKKEQMLRLVQQAKMSSKAFSIYSFISKGLSWLSNKEETVDPGNDLIRIRFHFNTQSTQISFLLQKIAEAIALKKAEIAWSSTSTQIDSVERLKAKILSGRPLIQRLITDIQSKLLIPLFEALKMEAQIHYQIEERSEAGKLFDYLRSNKEEEERIRPFAAKVQSFDRNMASQWPIFEQKWKETVSELDTKFRAIWKQYSESMSKIWR